MDPNYLQTACKHRTRPTLTANKKSERNPNRQKVVLQRAREHIANGLNVREAAIRLKVGKTALYAALQSASAADS